MNVICGLVGRLREGCKEEGKGVMEGGMGEEGLMEDKQRCEKGPAPGLAWLRFASQYTIIQLSRREVQVYESDV